MSAAAKSLLVQCAMHSVSVHWSAAESSVQIFVCGVLRICRIAAQPHPPSALVFSQSAVS